MTLGWVQATARTAGWGALVGLFIFGLQSRFAGPALEAGSWLGSLIGLSVLIAFLLPGALGRALPAAGLAVGTGGVIFSILPVSTDAWPLITLLAVTIATAGLVGALLLRGPQARKTQLPAAVLAGLWHVALIHVLTAPPLMSPFVAFPWVIPLIVLIWGIAGWFSGPGRLSAPELRPQ